MASGHVHGETRAGVTEGTRTSDRRNHKLNRQRASSQLRDLEGMLREVGVLGLPGGRTRSSASETRCIARANRSNRSITVRACGTGQ